MADLSRVPEPAHVATCLEALKTATAGAHARIEAVARMADLTAPGVTLAHYGAVLQRMHAHFARHEPALFAALAPHLPPGTLERRANLAALEADLHSLGLAPLPAAGPAAAFLCPATAAGWLYVHEGTGLGGLVVLKGLREHLGDELRGATRYYQRHGKATAALWRETRALIAGLLPDPAARTRAIAGAEAAFTAMQAELTRA
ncbi:hypothetical protein CKO11_16040 [Rhodobacter sp. TJ_12]|uniref:biliverdin-producing heme oxygenase n=1 Tax=Rhodobacter sp. TJ_12 TaxID=2029399 RepID=UPI001CC07DDC|nr:biliverdin-producing heme oxygenase [Rhodobacter sp. TJ_12]MBZ4023962.1 hypothetical protein [Rhodobacter sp. TJ_12]